MADSSCTVEEILENQEEIKASLTPEQKRALDMMIRGENMFITGEAGTGKTHLIQTARIELERLEKEVAVTAMTGIAASSIGGVTLHSFAGFGLEIKDKQVVKPAIRQRWQQVDVLIIDEISMAQADYFEKLGQIVAKIRQPKLKKNRKPFGGLQVIMIGDFFQLPPVNRDPNVETRYVFETDLWKSLRLKYAVLTTNVRQRGDRRYGELCNRVRQGKISIDDIRLLKSREGAEIGNSIVLTSRTEEADQINTEKMERLKIQLKNHPGITRQKYLTRIDMPKNIIVDPRGRRLDERYWKEKVNKVMPVEDCFELCLGSEVLLCVNMLKKKLCNGSRGRIVEFKEASGRDQELGFNYYPVVRFENGVEMAIRPFSWRIKMPIPVELLDETKVRDMNRASKSLVMVPVYNIPLKRGDAITIHKSQGLTLDRARVKLEKVFTHSQVYVALSRLTSIDGLSIIGVFEPDKIQVDRKVYEFQSTIEKQIILDQSQDIGNYFNASLDLDKMVANTTKKTSAAATTKSAQLDLLDDLDLDLDFEKPGQTITTTTTTTTTTTRNVKFLLPKKSEESEEKPKYKKRKREIGDLLDNLLFDDLAFPQDDKHNKKKKKKNEDDEKDEEDLLEPRLSIKQKTKTEEMFDQAEKMMMESSDPVVPDSIPIIVSVPPTSLVKRSKTAFDLHNHLHHGEDLF